MRLYFPFEDLIKISPIEGEGQFVQENLQKIAIDSFI